MTSVEDTMRSSFVSNAVSFLRDSASQESPLEKRIEFLRVKGLTQEEIDAALAQVGIARVDGQTASTSTSTSTLAAAETEYFSVPVTQQPQPVVHQYRDTAPQYNYAYDVRRMPPPEREKDWKDWFTMAVISGTVMVGAYSLAKKFIFPHLTPPPLDAFQQTQASLEAQFDAISKQLADLQAEADAQRQTVEASRDEVTKVVGDVDAALRELKAEEERAKLELKEIREEVNNVRELVPKLIQSSQASASSTLADVQAELKSLKTLLLQRPTQPSTPTMGYPLPPSSTPSLPYGIGSSTANLPFGAAPGASSSPPPGPNSSYLSTGRPSIPAWQLAAAAGNSTARSASSPAVQTTTTTTTTNTSTTDVASRTNLEESGVLVQNAEAEH